MKATEEQAQLLRSAGLLEWSNGGWINPAVGDALFNTADALAFVAAEDLRADLAAWSTAFDAAFPLCLEMISARTDAPPGVREALAQAAEAADAFALIKVGVMRQRRAAWRKGTDNA